MVIGTDMITATIQLKSEKIFFLFFFYKYSFFTGHTKGNAVSSDGIMEDIYLDSQA